MSKYALPTVNDWKEDPVKMQCPLQIIYHPQDKRQAWK